MYDMLLPEDLKETSAKATQKNETHHEDNNYFKQKESQLILKLQAYFITKESFMEKYLLENLPHICIL